jgi:four helix bundle protein
MNHKDLDVWKQAIQLVEDIYRVSSGFPKDEIYGITSQIRRAAVSIPSNISEGAARNSNKDFMRFLSIALGSLSELETQLLISSRLGYADTNKEQEQLIQVRTRLLGLRKYLRSKE